jgi:hypothetical protein
MCVDMGTHETLRSIGNIPEMGMYYEQSNEEM